MIKLFGQKISGDATDDEQLNDIIPTKANDEPEPEPEIKIPKNAINIDITNTITLYDFTIKNILIVPSTSATVLISIRTSSTEQERTIFLVGKAYTDWSTCDDYLYDYIRANIKSIY
jgi:hypothetical protein